MNYCCLNFSSMNYSCMHFIFELFLQKFQRISNRSEYCTLSSTDRPAVTGNHIRVRRRQAGLPAVALGAGVGWRSTHHHHEAGQIQQTGARLLAHTAHAHPLTPCGSLAFVLLHCVVSFLCWLFHRYFWWLFWNMNSPFSLLGPRHFCCGFLPPPPPHSLFRSCTIYCSIHLELAPTIECFSFCILSLRFITLFLCFLCHRPSPPTPLPPLDSISV